MTSDMASFFNTDEFAESVTYTPAGGAATTITAVVSRDQAFQEPYVRGENMATAEIAVQASEVTNPQYEDIYTIDSVVWEVDANQGVIYADDDMFIIALERRLT